MPLIEIEEEVIEKKSKPKSKKKTVSQTFFDPQEEGQVTVHCSIVGSEEAAYIRIWDSTFLYDNDSNHVSKLIGVYGVTKFPLWTEIPRNKNFTFTLLFSSLPKSCSTFNLIEEIPEDGGLEFKNIARNSADVYRVTM
jgi:hypothetical protein